MSNWKTYLLLLAMVSSMFLVQLNFIRSKPQFDEGTLLLIGSLMREGYTLYAQHSENKMPMIYMLPYLFYRIHQTDNLGIFFTLRIIMMLLTSTLIIPIFLICREYFNDKAGIIAALIYGSSLFVLKWGAYYHVSPLMMILETWAVYFFTRFMRHNDFKSLFLSGIATGAGISAKQTPLLLPPMFLVLLLLYGRNVLKGSIPKIITVFGVGVLLIFSPFMIYVYKTGELDNLFRYAFFYNATSRSVGVEYPHGGGFANKIRFFFDVCLGGLEAGLFGLLGITGLIHAFVRRSPGKTLVTLWFFTFFGFQMLLMDHVWDHYFLEFTVPLSILAGVFIVESKILEGLVDGLLTFFGYRSASAPRYLVSSFVSWVILLTVFSSIFWISMMIKFSLPHEQPVLFRSNMDTIEEELYLGEYLKNATNRTDSILVIGSESIYLWADRCWPRCIEKTTDMAPDSLAYITRYAKREDLDEAVKEWRASDLQYIVFTNDMDFIDIIKTNRTQPIKDFISKDFELDLFSMNFNNLLLFRRKGS